MLSEFEKVNLGRVKKSFVPTLTEQYYTSCSLSELLDIKARLDYVIEERKKNGEKVDV